MASFARSFKAPSFLSPKRRPAMSGRTLSNSSDLSLASNHSGVSDEADFAYSAPGTPVLLSPGEEPTGHKQGHHDGIAAGSHRSSTSRPIAIELPQIKQHPSSSTYTPTEPLSARGDLPGGYFPLHEETDRIHRTHPFHHDTKAPRHTVSAIPQTEHADSRAPGRLQPPLAAASQQSASPQISSYLPAGFHDHPLPLGKYYPSNYESRTSSTSQSTRPSSSSLMPPSVSSDSRVTTRSSVSSTSSAAAQDSEVRRKLLQYQRDMVAQATMAATEVLGTSKDGHNGDAALAQRNAALQELRLSAPAPHRPTSPRLLPLGSPGPVTPMELESGGSSYLDKAAGTGSPRTDGLAPSTLGIPRTA